ncbi:MAG: hypothetical protein ACIAQZ_00135 [Sedimentisphaeraceae bacterium JB056]
MDLKVWLLTLVMEIILLLGLLVYWFLSFIVLCKSGKEFEHDELKEKYRLKILKLKRVLRSLLIAIIFTIVIIIVFSI